jgi:hypothetical protein
MSMRAKSLWVAVIFSWVTIFGSASANAQDVWIQIEAHPDLRSARQRAVQFAGRIDAINVFNSSSGWYAISVGPFTQQNAESRRERLIDSGLVSADAYFVATSEYGRRVWPVGSANTASDTQSDGLVIGNSDTVGDADDAIAEDEVIEEVVVEVVEAIVVPSAEIDSETASQARSNERSLSRELKKEIQTALIWTGHYEGKIDGSFGRGTHGAIAEYQTSMGYDAFSYLTQLQIAELTAGYQHTLQRIGFQDIIDDRAGILVKMPLNLVTFDRYETPFVHFKSKPGVKASAMLISQNGGRDTLAALYDIMQTLEIVPIEGYRVQKKDWFVLSGRNETTVSYTYARHDDGLIKGFTLIWPPEEDRDMQRVSVAMFNSFKPLASGVLDDADATPQDDDNLDMVSGLEIRTPSRSASGVWINKDGDVLTDVSVIGDCTRITLDRDTDANVVATDTELGLALLSPDTKLAPFSYATFRDGRPRLRSEVILSGYSFGGVLDSASQSFGTLEDRKGLNGETYLTRLNIEAAPGDAGGPVLDDRGAFVGMLLPKSMNAKTLPADVQFAANSTSVAEFLGEHGVGIAQLIDADRLDAHDLTARAGDVTVLVSCWN